MNPTIIIRRTIIDRQGRRQPCWNGLAFWLAADKFGVFAGKRSTAIETACEAIPDPCPRSEALLPRPVSLAYPVMVDSSGTCWAIDEAVSVQAAHNAIAMARCTGTISTTESELTGPGTERIIARVHRLDEHGRRVRAR